MAAILIIEDDRDYGVLLRRVLEEDGHTAVVAHSGEEGLVRLAEARPDLVIADLGLPGIDGVEVLRRIHELEPGILCIIVSNRAAVDNVVAAMRAGAQDFISKSSELDEIRFRVGRALEAVRLHEQMSYLNDRALGQGSLVGVSAPMEELRRQIREIARAPVSSVLIVGETGTGKELVARAIHAQSDRRAGPLVTVNCAAIPVNLLESEFFGHERGAFTGADRSKKGFFELAHGGFLFLDEVGELDLRLQAKFLRALESHRFTRVGGGREIEVDVRILAATNRDLEHLCAEGVFREDLLYRLKVFQIFLPPLRDRGRDVLLLANTFIAEMNAKLQKRVSGIAPEAEKILLGYHYPGNVRQLRNLIEQALILTREDQIRPEHLRGLPRASGPAKPAPSQNGLPALVAEAAELEARFLSAERDVLDRALADAQGNKTRAAELLGISRYALNRRLRRLEGGDAEA